MLFESFTKKVMPCVVLAISLAGCMVGPDYQSQKAPSTMQYTASPMVKKTVSTPHLGSAGKAQYFVNGQDIPAEWWYLYHSQELNALIEKGLAHSPNLAAAEASLRQSQENLKALTGTLLFPSVNLGLSAERQLLSGSTFGGDVPSTFFNLFGATVNVAYTLDVFGGSRRQIEGAKAQVDYARYQWDAAYLTLTSNIVTTAITTASLSEQIKATRALIQIQENQLAIVKKQLHLGGASQIDVLTQENQLAQLRASLPPLEQSHTQTLHALSVLVGDLPSEDQLPKLNLKSIQLPTELPVSLPSDLVRQRPDIQASEALLHVASANVGVATANLYPQISLTGAFGYESGVPSTLFESINRNWNYGGSLTQPIFQGGALRAKKRAAIAAYDQALAQYKQTVLTAFQNVADTLRALEHDAQSLQANEAAETAAYRTQHITQKQFELGGISYLSLLTVEQQYQRTMINRIQAEATRYNDTAALFQALGGGWWNRQPVLAENVSVCCGKPIK